MVIRVHVHGGNVYRASRQHGRSPDEFIDFSANINPLGPSPRAVEAIKNHLHLIRHYPDPDCIELIQELARYLRVEPDNIVVGNGAAELIPLVTEQVAPRRGLVFSPTFVEYAVALERVGAEVIRVPYDSAHRHEVDADVLFLCHPNNPTGQLMKKTEIQDLVRRACSAGTVCVIDEAFIDFIDEPEAYSLRFDAVKRSDLVVLGSLTKFFAIPGLRVGYVVAAPDLVEKLRRIKPPWSVNCLAQVAAVASLQDRQYIADTRTYVAEARQALVAGLNELAERHGFQVWPASANFVFISLARTGPTAAELARRLAASGILVRDCSSFPLLDRYSLRVAVRKTEENERLLSELDRALN
ncbi:MAG: threonine-phosphate decarboxylase [Firmicutes bacterium]|nr:threonine-phosphate decarboxylase [Bacillota bacterium]